MQEELSLSSSDSEKQRGSMLFLVIFLVVLVVMSVIANYLTNGLFLDKLNLLIIVSNSIFPTFIAWGLCFLFACGFTDLSIGAVVVLASFMACMFGNWFGIPGVLFGGLVAGTLLIFINFTVFAFTKVPSWIASICIALFYEAVAVFLRLNRTTRPLINIELHHDYRTLGHFPANIILLAVGFLVVYVVYERSSIGMKIRAIGGNMEVSRALGINVLRTLLWVGLICGILIGFASVIQQSYNAFTIVMTGMTSLNLIFQPLAITLLAQIMQRKINIIIAIPICSFLIYAVFNLMTMFGIPGITLQQVFLGAFLISFGVGGQKGVKEVVK